MQTTPPPKRTNRSKWFKDILSTYKRVAIVGGPNSGKTTLSRLVRDRPVVHTDGFRHYSWAAVPEEVIKFVNQHANTKGFVLEGVQAARVLRKGLKVDAVVVLVEPLEENTKGQTAMSKAVMTVLADWWTNTDNKQTPLFQAPPVTIEDVTE